MLHIKTSSELSYRDSDSDEIKNIQTKWMISTSAESETDQHLIVRL